MHESLQTVRLQVLTISIVPFRTVNRESDNITDGQCYHIVVLIVLFLFALHCHYWNDCSLLFIDYIKSYFWLSDNLSLSCNTRKVCMHAMHFAGFVNVMEKWQITFYTRIQKGLPCGKKPFYTIEWEAECRRQTERSSPLSHCLFYWLWSVLSSMTLALLLLSWAKLSFPPPIETDCPPSPHSCVAWMLEITTGLRIRSLGCLTVANVGPVPQ